ncbi:MAG: hypothetical protein JNL64_15450 [Blastocatellia bacterium]|nr:hypothetical protein [Blastocatellia bacterium]
MKTPVLSIPIEDLEQFLRDQKLNFSSKHIELIASVFLAKFQAIQHGEEYCIAFPVKEKLRRDFGRHEHGDDIQVVLDYFVEENTPHDLYLVPVRQIPKRDSSTPGGHAFQLKRLISRHGDADSVESKTIEFLNNIPSKYGKTPHTTLVLVFETEVRDGQSANLKEIRDGLTFDSFPFEYVLFVAGDDETITFGELWPAFGTKTYARADF